MRTLELSVFTVWLCLHVSVHAFQHITVRDGYPLADGEMIEVSDRIIFPGTLWCGNGNIANGTDELGSWKQTDACCRTHDMCPDIIEAHGSKHGLTNSADYTRLSCECDEAFRHCLHNSGDTVSAALVGRTYFTILRTQCFRLDYPIVKCKVKSTILRRCKEYELDTNAPMKYQWFDVLEY
ncbi:phospholipase A2 [Bombus vancouverensis nearcticus]|uniref:Phospholipase A2 n=1 Tax=Bombus bifarius TaxID=103933 RepID=A0A6P8NYX3_9HYME|nr:phospholipase A2 [Bombus vancouverensis nearcticus]XP_033319182.1 phospholipase A2 [Bombus bifarius]